VVDYRKVRTAEPRDASRPAVLFPPCTAAWHDFEVFYSSLSGRSHQVGRSVFTFRRLRVLAILSEPNFCPPPFSTLSPFACPALAPFWSAASGNLIIRERDLGSRYSFRVYYLSSRGRLYSGFPFTVPSPAPCAFLSMTSGILQVSSSNYIFCSAPLGLTSLRL